MLALASTLVLALAPPDVRDVEVKLGFEVRCAGKPGKVELTAVVPQSIAGRQEIAAVETTPEATFFLKDGNRYARFAVEPGEGVTRLAIVIRARLHRCDRSTPAAKPSPLDDATRARLVAPEKFIESDDAKIAALAADLAAKDPKDARARIAATLDLVKRTLAPSPYGGDDRGARAALASGRGDCTEYADLFVALCRAQGLPARCVEGFVIDSPETHKHDWVEVWEDDARGFLPLDPFHADLGKSALDQAPNRYLLLSVLRSDPSLAGHHFAAWSSTGDPIAVRETFEVLKDRAAG